MNKNEKKFNYTKWGFILGTLLALPGAIIAIMTVPEIGCKVGWNSANCATAQQEIELITQSETGQVLPGVKIQVIGKGAPETQYTDDNGYTKIRIPSSGDVRVILEKEGYPPQNVLINLPNIQSTVRTVRFSRSGKPEVDAPSSTPSPSIQPSSSPSPAALSTSSGSKPIVSNVMFEDFSFELQSCDRQSQKLEYRLMITSLSKDKRLGLAAHKSRIFSKGRVFDGEVSKLGTSEGRSSDMVLPAKVPVQASIVFKEIPSDVSNLELLEVGFWQIDSAYTDKTIKFQSKSQVGIPINSQP